MDDLTKTEADITADLWKQIARVDRTLMTLRNALEQAGLGSSVATAASVVAEEAFELAKTAAKGEGHFNAVRMM